MAWYSINYTCGHSDREQLYGPERDRQSKIAWMERNKMCLPCYQAELDRQRAAALETARNESGGLPTLTGSDKQIAWAMTIRAMAKRHIETAVGLYVSAATQTGITLSASDATPEEITAFAGRVLRQTEAKYWIDNRAKFESAEIACRYLVKRALEIRAQSVGKNLITPPPILQRHVKENGMAK